MSFVDDGVVICTQRSYVFYGIPAVALLFQIG